MQLSGPVNYPLNSAQWPTLFPGSYLEPGTYFIQVIGQGGGGGWMYWGNQTASANTDGSATIGSQFVLISGNFYAENADVAFDVEGTPSTPEAATISTLLAGIAVVALRLRRQSIGN
jgi:hypothetical protein